MQSSTPVVKGLEPFELKIGGPEANQPQYRTLYALRAPDGRVMSRWEFSPEERTAIAEGADVLLSISTDGKPYPPTMMLLTSDGMASAEALKIDMQLDDELALRMLHQDVLNAQEAFQSKVQDINTKLQRQAEFRRSLSE